jgi:phage recombination protein Bet
MPNPAPLSEVLQASLDYIRERKRQAEMSNVTAIERANSETVVVHRDVSGPLEFTPQQCAMIRDTYASGADPKEFQVLMEIARVRRLNPLLRQVHFVKRWDNQKSREVWSVQVSVDGLRAIAERTGKYDGQDEPEYERDKDGCIISCKVKVYRKDWSRPAVGIAYWSEYVQTKKDGSPTKFWVSMPHVMIAKCAEAIAMRKAFPEDMGGLYVDEEMQQADNVRADTGGADNPRLAPGQDPDAKPLDGGALGTEIAKKLQSVKDAIPRCDSYEKTLLLRNIIGTHSAQSELMKRNQAGTESGTISPQQAGEIDKLWQHCHRQVAKKEAAYPQPAPVVDGEFEDPKDDDATDAFSPTREPGEEG